MAEITKSTEADFDANSALDAPRTPNLPGLVAGEDLKACDACYIAAADGKAYKCDATAADEKARVAGFALKDYDEGLPVSLYGPGVVLYYSDDFSAESVDPGAVLFLSDSVAGGLADAATTGDAVGVVQVLDNNHVIINRAFGA